VDEDAKLRIAEPLKPFLFFDGALLCVKYFFDVLDAEFLPPLLYRGLDFEGDVLRYPGYLQEAFESGKKLAEKICLPTGT